MERIVFLERNTFKVEFRKPRFEHEWIDHDDTAPHQVVERLQSATIAICNKLSLRASELSRLPKLKVIAVAATGTDNIDLEYCAQNSIAVCNARHYAGASLPEHVLLMMLALRRNLSAYRADVQAGKWQKAKQFCLLDHPIYDLQSTTLGVIGYGFLGKAVGKLAQAVGMKLLIAERKDATTVRPGRTAFDRVIESSDVITLHCPLTEETKNLIDQSQLQMMKSSCLLINAARGGLVNENALLQALNKGLIAGAACDVLSEEPPRGGNVLLDAQLPNLIVTPHIAWASREAMQILADQLVNSLEAFVRGEMLNRVV